MSYTVISRKPFGIVPHRRLMSVLSHYGIKEPLLPWINSFLVNRKQVVQVNGCRSNLFDVPSGVPQGSVLGPVLFIIYINFMLSKAENADIFPYADDLKLFKRVEMEYYAIALQNKLDKLYDWTKYSLLNFHPNKCVSMRIKQRSKALPFE